MVHRGWVRRWIMAVFCLLSASVSAEQVVRVGAYDFPPYAEVVTNGQVRGMVVDLIELLNSRQQEFRFEIFITTSKRRYIDFSEGRYDVIFFEMPKWGWHNTPHEPSRTFVHDEEVYIAMTGPGRDQRFFDNLSKRKLVGMLGYHYGFADFRADEDYLSTNFNILLSTSPSRNLQLILLDRGELAEVAVVTRSYLNRFLQQLPVHRRKLLIADRPDQVYQLSAILRPQSPVTARWVDQQLDAMEADGTLDKLRNEYGVKRIPPP